MCAILGAVAVSTNTRSVAQDLSYFADVTEAVCCLTQPKFAALIKEACANVKLIGVTDNDAGEVPEDAGSAVPPVAGIPFNALFAAEPLGLRPPNHQHNLSIQFTSGTTFGSEPRRDDHRRADHRALQEEPAGFQGGAQGSCGGCATAFDA